MANSNLEYAKHFESVMKTLTSQGLLVGSYDAQRKPNLMTIGWGTLGSIWGLPMWMVLVRPSRYTYRCIEHTGCFTVNVPTEAMNGACTTCGTKSGRDMDKFVACHLDVEKSEYVLAPRVAQCPLVYDCQVVHSNDVLPAKLSEEILKGSDVDSDFHRVYFGKILAVRATDDAAKLL